MLPSQQASLFLSSGFSNSSVPSTNPSLPLTVALQPGVLSYPQSLYRGQSTFTQLSAGPNRTTTTVPPGSFLVTLNTWAALTSSNRRIIVWDSIPDFVQLPLSSVGGSLSLTEIQSMACSSPCASTGTCLASGQCTVAVLLVSRACLAKVVHPNSLVPHATLVPLAVQHG